MASSECSAGNDSNIVPDNAHPTLESIRESGEVLQADSEPSAGDERILREEGQRQEFQEALTDQTRAQTEQIRDTGKLREKYAERVYTLLKWWVRVAVLLLVLDALDPPSIVRTPPVLLGLFLCLTSKNRPCSPSWAVQLSP